MPRLARIEIEGLLQHVMVRGIEKRDIFVDDRDRFEFVNRLSDLLVKTETDCFAWALMSNHVHLLLRPSKTKLSQLMRRLLTGYAVVFNLRHHRNGHLFQNRYKSIVCEEECYLLELVRYIHLNPLRAGVVSSIGSLDTYKWSGHSVLVGKESLAGQATDEVLQLFGERRKHAVMKYRSFVEDGIELGKRDELVGGGLKRYLTLSGSQDREAYDERVLGSGEFVEHLWQETERLPIRDASLPLDEIIARVAATFSLDTTVLYGGSKRKEVADARAVLCYLATRGSGCNGVELATRINITRSAVVHAAARGEDICRHMPDLVITEPSDPNQRKDLTSEPFRLK
jgi:putative transposase